MSSLVNWLSTFFLKNGIISEDDLPWFRYGLEKRITTIVVMILLFILAVLLSNICVSFAFLISFFALRSRTNGYHANRFLACFIHSILIELLFLGVAYPLLNNTVVYIVALICTTVIILFAPYNHPNMHLSTSEIVACRVSSRIRALCILVAIIVTNLLHIEDIAIGLALGLAMATFLLGLAYILKGGSKDEESN